jgi:hypothetical protein
LIRAWEREFLKRPEKLNPDQQRVIKDLCKRHKTLKVIREFVVDLFELFRKNQSKREARLRIVSMILNSRYKKNADLVLALKVLRKRGVFEKAITFLGYENLEQTTNHVERTNRWFRKRQKTHYRNRKERTITNMLKADLTGRIQNSNNPVQLIPRNNCPSAEEAVA